MNIDKELMALAEIVENATTLDQYIAKLEALRTQVGGNIPVVKRDMELGLENAFEFSVQRVFVENGWAVAYDDGMIAERREAAAKHYTDAEVREAYDDMVKTMAEADCPFEDTFEDYRKQFDAIPEGAKKTVALYDAGVQALVI